jgi:hypothetical protein
VTAPVATRLRTASTESVRNTTFGASLCLTNRRGGLRRLVDGELM